MNAAPATPVDHATVPPPLGAAATVPHQYQRQWTQSADGPVREGLGVLVSARHHGVSTHHPVHENFMRTRCRLSRAESLEPDPGQADTPAGPDVVPPTLTRRVASPRVDPQPFLHSLGAQRNGAAGAHVQQGGVGVRRIRRSDAPSAPFQASANRPAIIISVLNSRRTVHLKRPVMRVYPGRLPPLDNWSTVRSPNIWDAATAAKSGSTK